MEIFKYFRPYNNRSGEPKGHKHDGYTVNGVWYKTLREAKVAGGAGAAKFPKQAYAA